MSFVDYLADRAERLDQFLARKLPGHSRTRLARFIQDGQVTVDGERQKPGFRVRPGSLIRVQGEPPPLAAHDLEPWSYALDVPYEDEHLLVVNKPRGMATHPARSLKQPSLVNALLARGSTLSVGSEPFRPGIVHRLDKETTGLLLVAKTDQAHANLSRQIAARSVERRYVSVVEGALGPEAFRIDAPLARDPRNRLRMTVDASGKPAVTHVRLLAPVEQGTLIACRLETGRTHQIRAHLRCIGHPVVGDRLYGSKTDVALQLHAAYLAFDHPATGIRVNIYEPPPEDFIGAALVSEKELTSAW